jgi:tetratricopeptide (TPR) repeat protein
MVRRLCRQFGLYGLLLVSIPAFASSEEAVERNRLGATLLEEGKIDAATDEFQKSVVLDPKYFPARLNLAYAYERAGRIEEAANEYQRAIDLQPNNFFAHNNLGVLHDKKGRYDEAISAFQRAIQSEPGNSMALKNLETAKKNKAIVEERSAQIARAEKEAQNKQNDPRTSYNVARLYAAYGKKEQALEWLAKALKQGFKDLEDLKADAAFKDMREDRDFQLLLSRNGR